MVPEDKAPLKSHRIQEQVCGPSCHAVQLAAVPDSCDVSTVCFLIAG